MSRPSGPWFRKSRGMWYTTQDGKQLPLGITQEHDEKGAWDALERLLASRRPKPVEAVAGLVERFLLDAAQRVKPKTLKGYEFYCAAFVAKFANQPVTALQPEQIETDARRSSWSSSTRHNYLAVVSTVLRFGGVELSRPLRKPAKESAGAGSVIPEAVYRRMLGHVQGDWCAIIRFLWETGCRPSEASGIEEPMVDWPGKVVRLRDHKTRATSKADRIIYLNDAALEVLRWQQERHGGGLLFRGVHGQRFSPQSFVMKFQRLSKRIGHKVTSYAIRHTVATQMLASGESDTIVAAILGHAGTDMIHRHYSHVAAMGRELAAAAERRGKAS
jgi:integrase